jgi:hypothetical protein
MSTDSSSRKIVDAFYSGDSESFKSLVNKKMLELAVPKISEITAKSSRSIMSEEEGEEEAEIGSSISADDPTLDPSMEREYFLKSFEVGDVLVTIKTIGVGKNKPVSVYLDDQRWEMFPGPVNATKEAEEFVQSDQFEKWKERKGLLNKPDKEEEKDVETSGDEEEKEEETKPTNKTDDNDKKDVKKESVLVGLKKTLVEGKPQRIVFKNKEKMVTDNINAYYVVSLYESLNNRNKVEFERILNKNKSEFIRAVEFSYKNLMGKD